MDILLSKVTQQAMNYAIRSGITITAGYAFKQSTRLLKNVKGTEREELIELQERLQSKIRIISPAIDMVELIAARGNTSLESAVDLTKSLRWDIQNLGQRLAKAAAAEEIARRGGASTRTKAQNEVEIKLIIQAIKKLIERIEDAVPFINLAITTSGARLSTTLPSTVSPSRLLQASTFLTAGDTQYSMSAAQAVQCGPTFTLSLYMLFAGHIRPQDEESIRETTWKEVMHKARVKLRRVPLEMALELTPKASHNTLEKSHHMLGEIKADEFAYQLLLIEDLDDGRMHDFEDGEPKPGKFEDVELAGIREVIPIHEISKIFYADTGKILNIGAEGETNNPVLLLKRDVNAAPPRRMMQSSESQFGDYEEQEEEDEEDSSFDPDQSQMDSQFGENNSRAEPPSADPEPWRLPPGLDPEWIAFEVFTEAEDSDEESDNENEASNGRPSNSRSTSLDQQVISALSKVALDGSPRPSRTSTPNPYASETRYQQSTTLSNPIFNNIRTSLSLLETLLRLTSLQQFQQQSHLSITDELLNFFLEESSSTGAGGDEQHRQRVRAEARRRVGWDPYDESPLKRRGEDYQYQSGQSVDGWPSSPGAAGGQWDGPDSRDYYPDSQQYMLRSRDTTPTPAPSSPSPGIQPQSPSGTTSQRPQVGKQRSYISGGNENRIPSHLRKTGLRDNGVRGGSPLRPRTVQVDEGIGTSPGDAGVIKSVEGRE